MTDVPAAPSSSDRPSSEATKDAIRRAGARLFAERGFAATSVREIAKAASADPALVIRYFGSKEHLFLETMTVGTALQDATEGPLEHLGEALLRHLLQDAPRARRAYVALTRAADRQDVREYLLRANTANLIDPLTRRLSGPDARVRAALIAAQVSGLLNSLWILEDPVTTSTALEELIRIYGSAIQTIVDPTLSRSTDD